MRQFLDRLPEGGLIMCHPGFVDETLLSLDPLTTQREQEYAFLGGEHFPRCWRRTKLHWLDIACKNADALSHTINLIRTPTTGDTKPSYIWAALWDAKENAMTPQERQLIDDLFDRLSKVENAPRDPNAAAAIAQGLRTAPNAVYALVQTVLLQDEALRLAHQPDPNWNPGRRSNRNPADSSIRCERRFSDKISRTARCRTSPQPAPPGLEQRPGAAAMKARHSDRP